MILKRGFTPQELISLDSHFHVNLMVFIDWPDDPIRFHLGQGTIAWGGHSWSGIGPLGSIDLPVEAPGIAASTGQIRIVGFPVELEDIIDRRIRGVEVEIYLALMDETNRSTLKASPIALFRAAISSTRLITSNLTGSDIGNQSTDVPGTQDVYHTIEVDLTTGPSARAKASIYHTDEDQKLHYPTDTAGRLVILSRARAEKFKWPE